MVFRGRVKNGVVVLEDPKALPEGAEVSVRQVKPKRQPAKKPPAGKSLRPGLRKFAGKAESLPADASQYLDHYLYGHPKQP